MRLQILRAAVRDQRDVRQHDCVQALADLSLEQLLARYREEQKRPKGTTTKH